MREKGIALLLGLLLLLALNVDIHQEYDTKELIRFHVLAASDSAADQELKLAVKDRIITALAPLLDDSASINESRAILQANLPLIQQEAQAELASRGSAEAVAVQYGRFDFPVKYYGAFSLPAGNYEAVRVVIGEGCGQNWWCVLFPPMCFVDAGEVDADELAKYTTETPQKRQVVLKWRLAEILGL